MFLLGVDDLFTLHAKTVSLENFSGLGHFLGAQTKTSDVGNGNKLCIWFTKKTNYTCRAAMERLLSSILVSLETNYCSMAWTVIISTANWSK